MKILLCGGDRSGKSDYAQILTLQLAQGRTHYYAATMIPMDEEDHERIKSHLQRRAGMEFTTLLCGRNLLASTEKAEKNAVYLLDSITALLTNEMFRAENNYFPDEAAARRCLQELKLFLQKTEDVVLVSDNLFCECQNYSSETEFYLYWLGKANCIAASMCDTVIEMTAGVPMILKGSLPDEKSF